MGVMGLGEERMFFLEKGEEEHCTKAFGSVVSLLSSSCVPAPS